LVIEGDIFRFGQLDKTIGKIGIIGGLRSFNVSAYDSIVILHNSVEPDVGKLDRIILCRKQGGSVARMRPQQRARHRACRRASKSRTKPQQFHPGYPDVTKP
jgi:hypothetical protein